MADNAAPAAAVAAADLDSFVAATSTSSTHPPAEAAHQKVDSLTAAFDPLAAKPGDAAATAAKASTEAAPSAKLHLAELYSSPAKDVTTGGGAGAAPLGKLKLESAQPESLDDMLAELASGK
jgi:hypothetical protein